FEAVAGKFLAAWVFAGIALLLTFPMVITVNYLGEPDNGVIVAGYLGSWLLAGAFLA
ncbi:MAG TPA: ABC transporter permease, partial [Pseudomonas sp.]|nr:ABC transporter permease [Pseudomonas sp.]